jgi:hypothetical protein
MVNINHRDVGVMSLWYRRQFSAVKAKKMFAEAKPDSFYPHLAV